MWALTQLAGVDLVGIDVVGERLVDGLVEANEELCEILATASDQHGQAVMSVGGGGNTANGTEYAEGNVAIGNQFRDVGQGCRNECGVLRGGVLLHAAGLMTGTTLATIFQGSNSSMREMGWSAMRVSTSRR